jgi:hypothetical protein
MSRNKKEGVMCQTNTAQIGMVAKVGCGYLLHAGGSSTALRASAIKIQVRTVTS